MSAVSVERYDDFTGGLNLRADQFQLARNESPDMLNVEVDPRGGLFARGAMREINTTAIAGTWAPHKLYSFPGATPHLMLSNGTKVLKSTGGNFTTLQYSSGNDVTASATHGSCMIAWGKTLYLTTGTAGSGGYSWITTDTYATALTASGTAPHAWQTTPDASAHKMPTAEHIMIHANKMVVANTIEAGVAHPNRVRWSLESIPDNWDEDAFIDFEGGGDGITALAVVTGQLVVFKPTAVYVVYGYNFDDFQVVQLSPQLGALMHEHVAVGPNGVYFFSHPQGLYYYNGTQLIDVFMNLKSMYPDGFINSTADDQISVSYANDKVWLSMPFSKTTSVDYPSFCFVYDPTINNGSWTSFQIADGYAPVSGTDWTNALGESKPFMIHPNIPRVLEVDVYAEEKDLLAGVETAFDSYYRTGWVDGRSYSMKKMWRRPDIVVKQVDTSRTINVKVFHNFEEAVGNERKTFNIQLDASASGMLWGEGRWGSGKWGIQAAGAQVLRGSNLGLARSVQLLFTGPNGLYWGIDSIAYKFNTRKVTG
jgi:hypothetical protein